MKERWTENQGVRLQFLECGRPGCGMPLLFVPGAPGPAADFAPDMEALAPHHTLAVSLRGAVPSDAPESGYATADFASDVGAVLDAAGMNQVCLLGFSVAVTYVLPYATAHPERVRGLILIDYPARTQALPPEWVDRVLASAPPEFFRPVVVRGLQRDSAAEELWDHLRGITCPVLIITGGQPGVRLKADDLQRYQEVLPQAEVLVFAESGHDARRPDREHFQAAIREFLVRVEHEYVFRRR